MTTRRGPGAPSVTPEAGCPPAADLGAIRRTDTVVDLLGSRRLRRPRRLGDPVIMLLSSLNADVDTPAGTRRGWRGGRPAGAGARRYAGAHRHRGLRAGRRRPGTWLPAVAASMIFVAAAMTVTGLMMAGMVTRLTGTGTWDRPGR